MCASKATTWSGNSPAAARRRGGTLCVALAAATCLTGCAGGPIARQVASSLAMQAADKVAGEIVDSRRPPEKTVQYNPAVSAAPADAATLAFMMAEFKAPAAAPQPAAPVPAQPEPAIRVSKLVPVRVHGFVIGEEKAAVLARNGARWLQDAAPPAGWREWRLAEGAVREAQDGTLLFLVPPELDGMGSGDTAVVELVGDGGLAIARDKL